MGKLTVIFIVKIYKIYLG